EALSMSDRIAVMNRGEVEQCGTPREIYQRPRTAFVANFLGAMNWMNDIGVRPEYTRIGAANPVDAPTPGNRHPATVTRTVFLGSSIHVEARLESGQCLIAQVAPHENYREGDAVHIWWEACDQLRFD